MSIMTIFCSVDTHGHEHGSATSLRAIEWFEWEVGHRGGRGAGREREQQVVCKESSSVFITLL